MKCAICHNGKTEKGNTTVVLERDQTTLVYKNVPANICNNCGEEYISFLKQIKNCLAMQEVNQIEVLPLKCLTLRHDQQMFPPLNQQRDTPKILLNPRHAHLSF